jgi:hypothetical protein
VNLRVGLPELIERLFELAAYEMPQGGPRPTSEFAVVGMGERSSRCRLQPGSAVPARARRGRLQRALATNRIRNFVPFPAFLRLLFGITP